MFNIFFCLFKSSLWCMIFWIFFLLNWASVSAFKVECRCSISFFLNSTFSIAYVAFMNFTRSYEFYSDRCSLKWTNIGLNYLILSQSINSTFILSWSRITFYRWRVISLANLHFKLETFVRFSIFRLYYFPIWISIVGDRGWFLTKKEAIILRVIWSYSEVFTFTGLLALGFIKVFLFLTSPFIGFPFPVSSSFELVCWSIVLMRASSSSFVFYFLIFSEFSILSFWFLALDWLSSGPSYCFYTYFQDTLKITSYIFMTILIKNHLLNHT